jgi:hypothetical protein
MLKITDLHEAWQLILTRSATEQGEKSGWHQRQGQLKAEPICANGCVWVSGTPPCTTLDTWRGWQVRL